MSFCVEEPFVVSKIDEMEVTQHVAHGLETTSPVKDQEEQGQVDELFAQGSSALALSPFDALLNVIGFERLIGVDRFLIDDLCDKWSHELESLNAKSIFTSYDDPFLRNSGIDKHVISIVGSNLKDGLHAKMSKLLFVWNFELHEYVNENSKTKWSEVVDDFKICYVFIAK